MPSEARGGVTVGMPAIVGMSAVHGSPLKAGNPAGAYRRAWAIGVQAGATPITSIEKPYDVPATISGLTSGIKIRLPHPRSRPQRQGKPVAGQSAVRPAPEHLVAPP
jgi:hypothetical protein